MIRRRALHLLVVLAASALGASRDARADDDPKAEDHHLAFGMRAGVIPPVFVVLELLARPIPHAALGVFGVALPDRSTLGGELLVETATPGSSTPYLRLALARYADTSPASEHSTIAYATGGYEWKFDVGAEVEIGAGALFLISEEQGPCGAWCIRVEPPPVLPAIDLGVRAGFL